MSKAKRLTNTDRMVAMDNRTSELLDRTRPLQTMVGMAPGSFFGSTNEDVDIFLDECDRARRYNQWENGDVVVRLAYFLEGNARYAFEAEVADRVAKHRRAVNRATNGDDDPLAVRVDALDIGPGAHHHPAPARPVRVTNALSPAHEPACREVRPLNDRLQLFLGQGWLVDEPLHR